MPRDCLPNSMPEIFTVDLISPFSQVHAPTAKYKTAKISFSNPHTSTSPITRGQLSPYTWKPLIMLPVVYTSVHDDWAYDSSLLCAYQLGSKICENKTP